MASLLYQIMQNPAHASEIRRAALARPPMPSPGMRLPSPSPVPSGPPENIGEVGANPYPGPPVSTGPLGEDVTAQFERALPSPVMPRPAVAPAPVAADPAAFAPVPAADPVPAAPKQDDGRAMLRATAQALIAKGSPAQRVQGLQMMFEANQPTAEEKAAAALSSQFGVIDQSIADDEQKARAKTLVQLGAKTSEVAEALGFDSKGDTARKAQAKALVANAAKQASDTFANQTLKVAASDAVKLIDEEWAATGYPGAIASSLPIVGDATSAGKLESALTPIRSLVSMDRLQQLKEQSATGASGLGALSNVELRMIQSAQGALDITLDPAVLKRNIASIVAANDIFVELRKLAPAIEAGDAKAADQYVALSAKLGQIVPTIKGAYDDTQVAPDDAGAAFEQKYGGR